MRCAATLISLVVLSAMAGRLVLARRSSSVLPPPSRLACASASAFTGLCADLLLTSTTSMGGVEVLEQAAVGRHELQQQQRRVDHQRERDRDRQDLVAGGRRREIVESSATPTETGFADTGSAEESKARDDCM